MNTLPKRKTNRLSSYDYSQNGAYFVTICTHNRMRILSTIDVDSAKPIVSSYGKLVERSIAEIPCYFQGVTVDRYIIMPDHIHLLIRIDNGTGNPSPTIGTIIGRLKYTATKQINLLRHRLGEKVFQRSYHDHIIRNQTDYDEIWTYIENNPTAWNIRHHRTFL